MFNRETKSMINKKTNEYHCYSCLLNDNKEYILGSNDEFMICPKCNEKYNKPINPIIKLYTRK